ncbi:MAG: hypothetical protein CL940_09135 [Deltaproteobacteria bacterium]|nr:hypothetical protein [Deltaproteobacteria bacterium]
MSEESGIWCAERWLDCILESREVRVKVRKGRVIAKRGRVGDIRVQSGLATAQVSDDSGALYNTRVRMPAFDDDVWEDIVERLQEEVAHSAVLMTGRITEDMMDLFDAAGAELFPYDLQDLTYFCTCSDMSTMCVHAAALHFALADAIGADPFVLLEFRGRTRGWLTEQLKGESLQEILAGSEESGGEGDATEDVQELAKTYWEAGVLPHLAFRMGQRELDGDETLPVVRALGPGPGETPADLIAEALTPVVVISQRQLVDIVERYLDADPGSLDTPDPTVATSMDDVLVAAAYQHGSLTTTFVSDALGVSQSEARRYLRWLVEEGRLVQVGRARGTRYMPTDMANPDEIVVERSEEGASAE